MAIAENKAVMRGGAGVKDFPFTETGGLWFGLDPDDAPLMLRDVSTSDVYSLTLEQK